MTARRVAIIGPGRVGTLLALALPRAGHRVVAVVGGSAESRERFGARVAGVRLFDSVVEAAQGADLVVVATPDAAVEDVVRTLAVGGAVGEGDRVLHLAGALGLAPLRAAAMAGAGVAALHPAQTIPQDSAPDALVGAAWAVTASEADLAWARDLVVDLGGDPHEVRDADRVLYHAALVLGSNAVAAATSAAVQVLRAARVEDPAAFLNALAHRSVDNVLANGVVALTGPVVRGDVGTVARHLGDLEQDLPELATSYALLQRAVLQQARLTVAPEAAEQLRVLLDDHLGGSAT